MADKSLNIIAASAKLMADSARSMEALMEDLETTLSTQNTMLGAFVDKLDEIIKSMSGGGKGGDGGGKSGGGIFGALGIAGKDAKNLAKNVDEVGEGLPKFAQGMKDLAEALKIFSKVPEDVAQRVADTVVTLSDKLNKIDGKKMQEGGDALVSMARGIFLFGLSLAASSILYVMGALGALIIIPVISGFAYVFSLIGKAGNQIEAGAKAVGWMGLALFVFGLSLFAVKQLAGGSWGEYAKAALIVTAGIALFAFEFYVVGKFAGEIAKGALAMIGVGLALIVLSVGLMLFQNVTFTSVLVAGLGVAVTGLAFAIVGAFASNILMGSAAMIVGGLALVTLALGLGAFRLFGITSEDYMNAGAAILAVGGAMIVAGLGFIFIALGGAALIVASVALITLAAGLAIMNAVYLKAMTGLLAPSFQDKQRTNLDMIISGVVEAFFINPIKSAFMLVGAAALMVASIALITLAVGLTVMSALYTKAMDGLLAKSDNPDYQTNLDFVVSSVVNAFYINPVKSVFMLIGAAALMVASISLITLGLGITTFNWAYKKTIESKLFQPSKADPDVTNFEYTMDAIIDGMVMGPIRLMGLYAAVPAWIMAGIGLITIGSGLAKFVNIIEKNLDINKVGDMVSKVLTTVAETLINIGNGDAVDWDDVEDGIDAVSDVGNVISGIAEGLAKMAELKFPIYAQDGSGKIKGYFTVGDKQFEQVTKNMKMIITAIAGTLTEIGASQGETGWFSKTDGEKGADVIKGIGADLVGLADFVQKAADLTFPIYDKDGKEIGKKTIDPKMLEKGGSVYRNIVAMIRSVSDALSEIGSGEAAQSGWFSDSDIEKGKQAVAGIGADLNGIAEMVQSVATVQNFDEVDRNIRRTLILIPEAMLGAYDIMSKNSGKMMMVGAILQNAMGPIGQVIEGLAKVTEKKITDKEALTLGVALKSLVEGLAGIAPDANYDKFGEAVGYIERLAAATDPISKLASSMEKVAKSFDKFAMSFKKMNKETLTNSNLLIQSLVMFSKVDANAFNSVAGKGKLFIDFIYEKNGMKSPTASTPPTNPTAPPKTNDQAGTKPAVVNDPKKPNTQQQNAQMSTQEIVDAIGSLRTVMEEVLDRLNKPLKTTTG